MAQGGLGWGGSVETPHPRNRAVPTAGNSLPKESGVAGCPSRVCCRPPLLSPCPWGQTCVLSPTCQPGPGAGLVPVVLCLQQQLRKRTKCFSGSRIINFNLYIKSFKYWLCWRLWGRLGFSRVGELGISYLGTFQCRDPPAWNTGMGSEKGMEGTGWHICPSACTSGHTSARTSAPPWGSGVCLPQPPGSSSPSRNVPLTHRCPWG